MSGSCIVLDEELICFDTGSDWFSILRSQRLGQINGASVEGTGDEMLELAAALDACTPFVAERCCVAWSMSKDAFTLHSPRNSLSSTYVMARWAAPLSASIRKEVAEARARPPAESLGDWDEDDDEVSSESS